MTDNIQSADSRASLFDDPAAYCDKYYSFAPGSEESEHDILKQRLGIFHDLYDNNAGDLTNARILELGGGPTICSLISAVKHAESITFTDGSEKNVDFVQKWKQGGSEAYDFSSLLGYTVAQLEKNTDQSATTERQNEIRTKLINVQKADVTDENPLDASFQGYFDVLSIHYCLLHAVKSHEEYTPCLQNLARYLKPNGLLILSEMLGCFHAQRQLEQSKKHGDEQHDHNHHHGEGHDHGHAQHGHASDQKEHDTSGHDHGHQAKTKQFIFDSVESAGFDVIEHHFIARDMALVDVPGAEDGGAWTTVVILARKRA